MMFKIYRDVRSSSELFFSFFLFISLLKDVVIHRLLFCLVRVSSTLLSVSYLFATIKTMRECVSVHVGQAGIQMGAACWELFCIEHRIQPDGTISPNSILTDDSLSVETFFHKLDDGRYTPRTIMADLEPTVTGTSTITLPSGF